MSFKKIACEVDAAGNGWLEVDGVRMDCAGFTLDVDARGSVELNIRYAHIRVGGERDAHGFFVSTAKREPRLTVQPDGVLVRGPVTIE
jgi:hypothetical protein